MIEVLYRYFICFPLKLLKRNAASRLGAGPGDAGEVQVGIDIFGVLGKDNAHFVFVRVVCSCL